MKKLGLKQDLNLEVCGYGRVGVGGGGQLKLRNQRELRDPGQVFKAKTSSQYRKSVTRPGVVTKQDGNPVIRLMHKVNTQNQQ